VLGRGSPHSRRGNLLTAAIPDERLTPEQNRQVEDIFNLIADLPPDQHDAELARLCPDDAQVRAEVAKLRAALNLEYESGELLAKYSAGCT